MKAQPEKDGESKKRIGRVLGRRQKTDLMTM